MKGIIRIFFIRFIIFFLFEFYILTVISTEIDTSGEDPVPLNINFLETNEGNCLNTLEQHAYYSYNVSSNQIKPFNTFENPGSFFEHEYDELFENGNATLDSPETTKNILNLQMGERENKQMNYVPYDYSNYNTVVATTVEEQVPNIIKQNENAELEIDSSKLFDMVEETLGPENMKLLENYAKESMNLELNKEEFSLMQSTEGNPIGGSTVHMVEEPSCSYSYCMINFEVGQTNISVNRKEENHTDPNEEKKKKNEQMNKEFTYFEKYEIVNLSLVSYICPFIRVARALSDINACIKDININDFNDIKNNLTNIRCKYAWYVLGMYTNPINEKKKASTEYVRMLMSSIKNSNVSLVFPEFQDDPICILDSMVSIQLYLDLLTNFSNDALSMSRRRIKNFIHQKEVMFGRLPPNGKQLPLVTMKLKSIFLSLATSSDKKLKFREQRGFYRIIYLLENTFIKKIEENSLYSLSPILKKLGNLGLIHAPFFIEMNLIDEENLNELIDLFEKNTLSKYLERIQKFLSYLNEEQAKIKMKLRNKLKEPRMISLFILYHMSYLMLQHCFNMQNAYENIRISIQTYKSFISLWDSMFPNLSESVAYNNLTNWEKSTLINNESSVYCIIQYILFNMVKIPLIGMIRSHEAYLNKMKHYVYSNTVCSEKDVLKEERTAYKKSVQTLKELNEVLDIMYKQKYVIRSHIQFYLYEDLINKRINDILHVLRRANTYTVKDEVMLKVIKGYDILHPLYGRMIKLSQECLK